MATTVESLSIQISSNSKSAVGGIDALIKSLTKLKTATKGFGTATVTREMKNVSSSTKTASASFTDFYHKITMLAQAFRIVSGAISSAVSKSTEYIETVNLFTVSLGEYAEEAAVYANTASEIMGIDPSEWMKGQGTLMTLARGFGVAGERAYEMSTQLTQLAYDISSFQNISVEEAMQKLQSGFAGELEPLRRIGYDLSQAKLEATALALGIDKSVSSMTQAEKAELRYYAIMTQVTHQQGDMARTIEDPANQLRILKARFEVAARSVGNIFIPALQKILPYAIAITDIFGEMAQSIALAFGFEMPEIDSSGVDAMGEVAASTEDAMDEAAESAKKLKSHMLGFDELNVINPDTGSSDSAGGASDSKGFDFELPTYDFLGGADNSKIEAIVETIKGSLAEIELIFAGASLAIGAILAFSGASIPLGIALMAAGAIGLGVAVATNWGAIVELMSGPVGTVTGIMSGASLAIGGVLAFSGANIPLGIALMMVGAAGLATSIAANWNSVSEALQGPIGVVTGIVSAAVFALGAIIAFSGANIPLGISLMLLGAAGLTTVLAPNWNSVQEALEGPIGVVTGIVSGAVLALGAILAFSGANIGLGIALMLLGAGGLATVIAANWDSVKNALEGPIGTVTGIVSGAVLALGAILAFSGASIPLGIALMLLGAAGLATVIATNWNSISDALGGPIGAVTTIVSGALLALGAILAFTGVGIPLGVSLILAGAAGLVTMAALNWDSITEALRGPVGKITAIISGALLVLGAILLFTGVGIPLGIGLMLAGAAGLGTVVAVNWDFLVGKIKGIWESIKTFWNTYIAPIFTAEWWLNLGKTCINGLISGFEAGINGIIGMFETMINWVVDGLNKISFDVPDWVPLIGGKTFGFNIPKVSFGRVSIPRFAEGGFPEQGQMFIAREAGAEMVGSIGRRTAVANNDQIVAGIASGVAEANDEQNALLREQNSLLRAILEKDSGTYLDGKSLTNSVEKYQRERGRVLITGGVL